eukprot:gene72-4321_t
MEKEEEAPKQSRYQLRTPKVKPEYKEVSETSTETTEKKRKRSEDTGKTKTEKKPKTEKKESKRVKLSPFEPDEKTIKEIQKSKEEKKGKYETDCCNTCTSREVIRIASEKKLKDLKGILDDVKHVSDPFIYKNQKEDENVFDIALKNNDLAMLKVLIKEKKEPKDRHVDGNGLQKILRGNYSRRNFGHGVRNISQGKGNKEGNDAFTERQSDHDDYESKYILKKIQKYKLSKEILDFLSVEIEEFSNYFGHDVGFYQNIESGNLENAQYIAKHLKDEGDAAGLNNLHVESLGSSDENFSKILAMSVTKKAASNFRITPIHTAAINPNNKYLKELILKASEKSISGHHVIDALQRKPIHFAAVSDTSDNLKYLIEQCNSDPVECDKSKMNPFLFSCKNGKLENVQYLTSDQYPLMIQSKNGFRDTGLHLAARRGHVKVVEYLLTVPNCDKSYKNTKAETPLAVASQYGHFDIVKLLIASKLDINQELKGDKFKKTPLHHSVMNGHFEISKYLLLNGFDPNSVDTSNNSVVHYAAAFGYADILNLLSLAGGAINVVSDWSTSPLSVSLIKGHLKTSNIILKDPTVDVNFVDNENKTMLHQLLEKKEGNFDRQIKYLIDEKKAKTDILTVDGTSILHVLSSSVHEKDVDIAKVLIKNGMDVNHTDNHGMSSFLLACDAGNIPLIQFYLQQKKIDVFQSNSDNQNFLHLIHKNLNQKDIKEVLDVIIPHIKTKKKWEELRNQFDNFGYSPLLVLFSEFHNKQVDNVVGFGGGTNQFISDNEEDGSKNGSDVESGDESHDENDENDHSEEEDNSMNDSIYIEQNPPTGENRLKFIEYVKLLFTHYSNDINHQIKKSEKKKKSKLIGYSVLHFLSKDENPNIELLELLISYKANVNILDEVKRNPLHISFKTIKKLKGFEFDGLLLENGCDVNALDSQNRTPLFYIFIQSKVNEHSYWDWETQVERTFKFSSDPIEIISDVFSFTDKININQKDIYGRTLLHEACLKGAPTCSMFLIQKGSLVEEEDEDKNTPLCLALISGFKDFAITLINKNANAKRNLKVLSKPEKFLIKQENDDDEDDDDEFSGNRKKKKRPNYSNRFSTVDDEDEDIEEPTMSIFKFMLKKDWMGLAYLVLTDIEPMSAVHDALETENYQLVLTLISKTNSSKLKECDSSQQNIFHKISSFQPKLNAEMDKKISSFQHFSKKIFIDLKKKLNEKDIESSMLNKQDQFGKTSLHYAAESGNLQFSKCLIENNQEIINLQDNNGMTALMYASKFNHLPVVKCLIDHKSDINKLDNDKKTALIHFIHPSNFGSYENIDLLNYLIKHGSSMDKKDKDNKTAIQYASMKFSKTLYNELIKLGGKKENKKMDKPKTKTPAYEKINFESDLENALKEIKDKEMDVEEESDQEVKVDSRSGLKNCQVLKDNNDKYYDVLLSKADVLKGPYGYYLFYKLQIIYNPIQKIYILFNCWGRWGDNGEFQRTPFKSEADAVKEFKSLFKSKTKNEWNSDQFEEHIGSYVILKLKKKKKFNRLPELHINKNESKLDNATFNLMQEITSVTSTTKSLNSIGISGSMMPFGDLEEDVLKRGILILKNIYTLMKDIENNHDLSPKDVKEKYYEMAKESNKFYQLIPHQGFEESSLGLIRNENEISQKIKMIDLLMNLEISSRIIITSNYNSKKLNPIDYCYYSLFNHIKRMDQSSFEFHVLHQYFARTKSNEYELVNIFSLQRKEEEERFKKHENDENRVLLWHGSSISNFIGILNQGLRIAPPEAPAAGYAFGKGIYFADQFSKSINYSRDHNSSTSLLVLCEVALGKISKLSQPKYMEKPMQGFNSTQGVGKKGPSFNESFITDDGLKIPCGQIQEQ